MPLGLLVRLLSLLVGFLGVLLLSLGVFFLGFGVLGLRLHARRGGWRVGGLRSAGGSSVLSHRSGASGDGWVCGFRSGSRVSHHRGRNCVVSFRSKCGVAGLRGRSRSSILSLGSGGRILGLLLGRRVLRHRGRGRVLGFLAVC